MNKIYITIFLIAFVALDAGAQELGAVSENKELVEMNETTSTATQIDSAVEIDSNDVVPSKGNDTEKKESIGVEEKTKNVEKKPESKKNAVTQDSTDKNVDVNQGKERLNAATDGKHTPGEKPKENQSKKEQKPAKSSVFVEARPFPLNTEGRIQLAFPVSWVWRTDTGYDFFTTKDRLGNYGANMEVDVWRLKPRMVLSAGITWMRERASSKNVMSGNYNTWWKADSVTLHAKFRFRVLSWLNVHARLQGGAEYTKAIVLDKIERNKYFRDWNGNFIGGIGGGFSVQTPSVLRFKTKMPVFSLGLLVEGGVLFGPEADITFDFSGGTANSINVHSQSLGELSRTTPYLRMDAFIRF